MVALVATMIPAVMMTTVTMVTATTTIAATIPTPATEVLRAAVK
jgi:hypothetical protein